MKQKQNIVVFAVLILSFILSSAGLDAAIKKGPYLMLNGNSSTQMTVLWQTDISQTCTLEWGTSTAYGNTITSTEFGTDHQHKYIISGLANNTIYYYRVTVGGSAYSGSFRSAPGAAATAVKLFAYADTRTYYADHAKVAGKMIDTYTADPLFQTISLFAGDYANTDSESSWAGEFFPRSQANIMKLQAEVPIMPCRGNHEGSGTQLAKYYPYPYVANFYYSFDYGPVHVAVLDQNPAASPQISTVQKTWLANDLAATTKLWKILVVHSPGWSAGGGHENDTQIQNEIQPICVQYGVHFVFCGDNHYYARALVDGVTHITTGGGGAPLYRPKTGYPYILVTEDNYQFCKINIQGNTLYFDAIDYMGNTIDSVTLTATTEPVLTADFTVQTNLLNAVFTDTSKAQNTTITSWNWNFGDNTSSQQQHPSHTYAAPGTYTVCLTISDGTGTVNSICKPVTVTTTLNYCASASANYSSEWIAGVQVGNLTNTSAASAYTDFTAKTTTVGKGASVSLKLTPGFKSTSRSEYWKIWIDYNGNGSFNDAGENVYSGSGKTAKSGSFTVPVSAVTGPVRMRVAMQYKTAPVSCGTLTYGEVEDYTVIIQ